MRGPGCFRLTLLAAVLQACASGWALGESLPVEDKAPDQWRFSITPYIFLPTRTSGASTVAGQRVDLDLNLNDVLDILQGAASIRGEAWRGNFGIISDIYYVEIEDSVTLGLPGPLGGSAKLMSNTKQSWASLLGAYRFAEGAAGPGGRRYAFDVSGGARWNSLRQTIDIRGDVPIGPGLRPNVNLGGTETWWEPVIGLRGVVEVADRWTLGARIDLGGFGAGGDRLQYLVLAGVDWRAWERTSIKLGWQFYGIDFSTDRSDGKFAYDVDQNGPYLGITFRF